MSSPLGIHTIGFFIVKKIGQAVDLAPFYGQIDERVRSLLYISEAAPRQYFTSTLKPCQVVKNDVINFQLGNQTLQLFGQVSIWDFGSVSIYYNCPLPEDIDIADIDTRLTEIKALVENDATEFCNTLQSVCASYIKDPCHSSLIEDWHVFFGDPDNGTILAHYKADYGHDYGLMLWRDVNINSEDAGREIFAGAFARDDNDFVIIDWDAGIIVSEKWKGIIQVIEYNLMLSIEMRVLLERLDQQLDGLAAKLASRWAVYIFRLRHLSILSIESILTYDSVSDTLDLPGQRFLSVINELAAKRFRLNEFDNDIQRKMDALRNVYQRIYGQNHTFLAHLLELTIIILILIEIIMNWP